jgi:protein-S-isoprenylcysteine O-methyltransferase Ste14
MIFYLLIGFEIVYMISPFALYYYSVYGQSLNFLSENPVTAWLTTFFLPHVAKTSSTLLNTVGDVGWTLALLGFLAFCVGAAQIYYYKFARKGMVIGGVYNFIRHPQYVSLSVCSLGLLLAWPRYLVLISFVTMLFAY